MNAINSEFSLKNFLKEINTEAFYLSSFDHYLSEYVPADDSLRVFLTQFTGSVAEALILEDGKIHLYVDGRYHEQADLECDESRVQVVKVPYGTSLVEALNEDVSQLKSLGFIPERTPQKLKEQWSHLSWVSVDEDLFYQKIGFQRPKYSGKTWEVPYEKSKDHLLLKWQRCLKEGEAAFLCGLDAVAWASGLRSNMLPYQGTFRSLAIMERGCVSLFVEDAYFDSLSGFENEFRKIYKREELKTALEGLVGIETLWWDEAFTTCAQYDEAKEVMGKKLQPHPGYHQDWMSYKSEEEKEAFRTSFDKSSQAIYEGLCWLVEKARSGSEVSEISFRDHFESFYQNQGAHTQSFRTIAGFGAHGSIIHFGKPEDSTFVQEGDLVLCDSGAIYDEGFATDCTRTILPLGTPTEKQKKQYTLVLKGLIKLLKAKFKEGQLGKELDVLARESLQSEGMDYAHGTGHGVGVNVHEGGYSINPKSVVPMRANRVGSLEPGFYEPGVGGIRLENIAIVQKAEDSLLEFEDLVTVGFWLPLVEESLLEREEKDFLNAYEKKCKEKGRSFSHFF